MIKEEITKWSAKEFKEEVINKIITARKPIEYTFLAGFERNGIEVYETQIINIDQLRELFTYFENYFVTEEEEKIRVKRFH